jgi:uncharacterized protein (TIGR02598 family)
MIAANAGAAVARPGRSAAFTLVEIVLVLAVIATALIALIGVLPVGMNASRQAADQTVVALIYEDVHNRLQSEKLVAGVASFSPAFFDDRGVFIPTTSNPSSGTPNTNAFYRADVSIGAWNAAPVNTSGLLPVTIALSWPVDAASGQPLGAKNPQSFVTFGVAPLTGPSWQVIDSTYAPKVEF